MDQAPDMLLRMQQQTQDWLRAGDHRSVFLECYTLMTGNMLSAIDEGRFHDEFWAKQLLLRFAEYYFLATEHYDRQHGSCAGVWRFAHDCACKNNLHVLQHLLLGINAHINYDLVLALVDLLEPEWDRLGPADRRLRYEDHCRVNEIIAATIDTVQDTVVERYDPRLDLVDRLLGRLDERLLSQLITGWRHNVWDKALLFLDATPDQVDALRLTLEDTVMKRARKIAF